MSTTVDYCAERRTCLAVEVQMTGVCRGEAANGRVQVTLGGRVMLGHICEG